MCSVVALSALVSRKFLAARTFEHKGVSLTSRSLSGDEGVVVGIGVQVLVEGDLQAVFLRARAEPTSG